ncbi:Peptidoglycan-associated lipoprotein [Candidatus Kinetoplastibacterium sorsogonicusi]|uniref:Peptidoglycan-associated lipoprotein n=1 Tax=Candidatus Kinetoplastidibacterium kentomonadis TaxID=1576550 RepID=A0A3S7JAK3_9PROT|nr:OmpA family protein [Candidatus Kinetoplastibacterium sorsogonicusi]AWD32671.1 Peptidoglycan-associated lipoprotein [Candidatus Kinetoplastibacterium sorsogonicusi]
MKFVQKIIYIICLITLSSCAPNYLGHHITSNKLFYDENVDIKNFTIYFEKNSYSISKNYIQLINKHANLLISNPDIKIKIEGYTDDKGSAEYNLALGKCRANSVSNMLQLLGVSKNQIYINSFGKERKYQNNNKNTFDKVEIIYIK